MVTILERSRKADRKRLDTAHDLARKLFPDHETGFMKKDFTRTKDIDQAVGLILKKKGSNNYSMWDLYIDIEKSEIVATAKEHYDAAILLAIEYEKEIREPVKLTKSGYHD